MVELRQVRVIPLPLPRRPAVVCALLLSAATGPMAAAQTGPTVAPAACAGSPAVAERVARGDVSVAAAPSPSGGPLTPTVFSAETSRVQRDSLARHRASSAVHSNAAGDVATPTSGAAPGGASRSGSAIRSWTVQVASYETLDEATTMQQTLCQRGYDTRIVGTGRPYTVRVGRFDTSHAALAVARRLANRKLTVFITPAEP
jgi:cell division protein FtsN